MHTVKEVSELLNLSLRAVQKRAKKANINKSGNTYLIPNNIVKEWEKELNSVQDELNSEVTETFSLEQYEKLQQVIAEYPELLKEIKDKKEQIEFLRSELSERTAQMNTLITTINDSIKTLHQTNYIQAKDKGYEG